MAGTPMHTRDEQRINERLDTDTLICALCAVGLWGVLLTLCLLLPPV